MGGAGAGTSTGALVPTVKSEPPPPLTEPPVMLQDASTSAAPETESHPNLESEEREEPTAAAVEAAGVESAGPSTATVTAEIGVDRDLLCPICMQIIRDAFMTACGHSFCYTCIVTHLRNKSDCPCCGHYLTSSNLFPNFLLNKLLKKTSARQLAKTSSPFENLRQALQKGCEVSVKELDGLLSLLLERKRKMEQEEAESNMQILLDFLHCLRRQKVEELNEIQTDLQYIKEDINAVERYRMELHRAKERYSVKLRMMRSNPKETRPRSIDRYHSGINSGAPIIQHGHGSGNQQSKNDDLKAAVGTQGPQRQDTNSGSDPQHISPSVSLTAKKRRLHAQFSELQDCYLQKRRYWSQQPHGTEERDIRAMPREGYTMGLEDFQSVLSSFTRYSRLRVVAELRHVDLFHSANIVSSIEFDRDDELFATAGVSRSIKIFEFSSIVNKPAEVHCPVVEMSTLSKLSCLSWNKYTKNHIASSDYEGILTVWDINTRQSVMEYEEHEKRAWSVEFSHTDPSMLVSGSDDCKVKVWSTKQEASVLNIDMKANICSVKYNPGSSVHIAVGSADHHIHYYDLRHTSQPLHVFSGHKKAVSYVKFMSNNELASASTDSTLRLWDVKDNLPVRTFRGHMNEKNFVGLTVNTEFIACGSETNEVFVYHKAISKPVAHHKFSSSNQEESEEDLGSYFISAVCWKSNSPTMLTANSQGTIKVLVLAA